MRTVEAVEKQLPKQGTSFVDCPLNILALLITDPSYVVSTLVTGPDKVLTHVAIGRQCASCSIGSKVTQLAWI